MPRERQQKPKQEYTFAPEVEAVAADLIAKHHKHLDAKQGVKIIYLFCEVPEKNHGMHVLGTARKYGGMDAFLIGHFARAATAASAKTASDFLLGDWSLWDDSGPEFFVMTICKRAWQFALSEKQKIALVDHELCHFGTKGDKDGKLRLELLPHDSEEFVAVVKRHGAWSPDVAAILKAAAAGPQLTFEQIAEIETRDRKAA